MFEDSISSREICNENSTILSFTKSIGLIQTGIQGKEIYRPTSSPSRETTSLTENPLIRLSTKDLEDKYQQNSQNSKRHNFSEHLHSSQNGNSFATRTRQAMKMNENGTINANKKSPIKISKRLRKGTTPFSA